MLPVSRRSPENSRPLGLLFSNNLNLHIKISNFLAKSDHFEHFLKCFNPFCIGKNRLRLSIFWMNQKILSIFQNILSFFEKIHFWKFLQVFWPILYGKKLILRFSIFWMNQKILSIFQKNFYYEENVFLTLRSEENIFLTAQSEENIVLTELCYKLLWTNKKVQWTNNSFKFRKYW